MTIDINYKQQEIINLRNAASQKAIAWNNYELQKALMDPHYVAQYKNLKDFLETDKDD